MKEGQILIRFIFKKLINSELQEKLKLFKMIDNRIYCDYYKLNKSLIKYLLEVIKNKNLTSNFENKDYPAYKDLDYNEDYNFELTIEIYNDNIQILELLNNEYNLREKKIK